nr:hypothetical protein CFP56_57920 [Quercus suber]
MQYGSSDFAGASGLWNGRKEGRSGQGLVGLRWTRCWRTFSRCFFRDRYYEVFAICEMAAAPAAGRLSKRAREAEVEGIFTAVNLGGRRLARRQTDDGMLSVAER